MDRLKMRSANKIKENIKAIGALFPHALTEVIKGYREDGSPLVEQAIDFDVLRQELSEVIVEGEEERYQFTWPDKKKAMLLANVSTNQTLRPCRAESVNFDDTENLYIEGDNLNVLKLLQEAYLGKIKVIYIDPPYNTGKDLVYADDFAQSAKDYLAGSGQYDEEGNRLVTNVESSGRFHTNWLNMIYPRLKVAKDLLTDDGLIFISINDWEVHNLRKVCDEIFGPRNFVADLIWTNKEGGGSSDSRLFRIKHEHILCYARNIAMVEITGVPITNEERYKLSDEYEPIRGKYYLQKLGMSSIQYSESLDYPIPTPDGGYVTPAENNGGRKACWRWSKQKFEWGLANGFIEMKKDAAGVWIVYTKQYLNCDHEGNLIQRRQRPLGVIDSFSSTQATKLLKSMQMDGYFDYPKPVELIKYLLQRTDAREAIILDFFSGSATTAHAVMELNAEDGGRRRFIMVQLPEETGEQSAAYRAGFKTICDIGKERIRRAGQKILAEHPECQGQLDRGFRVLKLDSSNMKEVYYTPADYVKQNFFDLQDHIKPDRTPEDLLFQVMLDLGILLSSKIEEINVQGKKVYRVAGGYLLACFDQGITEEVVEAVAKQQPRYAVFRDSGMAGDSVVTNCDRIFKMNSPATMVKIL